MRNKYLFYAVFSAAVIAIGVSSCYKIFRTYAPEEVVAGQSFDVKMVVIDNGDANQKEITDWSVAAIRVPDDWEVKCSTHDYQSFAEDWVYYTDGKPANAKYSMRYSESLSGAYNEAAPKEGYKWMAYVSSVKVTKFMSSCWRNGCDSAVVTFHVTAGNRPGTYTIDYLAGDSEQDASPRGYSSASDLSIDRMINASTVESFLLPEKKTTGNYAPALASTIRVVAASDPIETVETSSAKTATEYSIDGKRLNNNSSYRGITIVNGRKKLRR